VISRCYLVTLAHLSSFPMMNHTFIFYMPPSEISFLIPLDQKNFILIFQIFTLHVCIFASNITNNVCDHISLQKKATLYPNLIDWIPTDHVGHLHYAFNNLLWHCESTPPSASSQLLEEIINFHLHDPDSSFANIMPGWLFGLVPRFLEFIMTLVHPTFFPHFI